MVDDDTAHETKYGPHNRLTVTIDRSLWLRGEHGNLSYLIRPKDGKMCCLGFVALAAGIEREEIYGAISPESRVLVRNHWQDLLPGVPITATLGGLMNDNDSPDMEPMEREERITAGLARLGVDATFVDGDPPVWRTEIVASQRSPALEERIREAGHRLMYVTRRAKVPYSVLDLSNWDDVWQTTATVEQLWEILGVEDRIGWKVVMPPSLWRELAIP